MLIKKMVPVLPEPEDIIGQISHTDTHRNIYSWRIENNDIFNGYFNTELL